MQSIKDVDPEVIFKVLEDSVKKHAKSFYELGVGQFKLNKHAEAEKSLKKAIELSPQNALYFCYLRSAQMALNKKKKAEENLQKAIELGFTERGIFNALGSAQLGLNKYTEAEKSLKEAIKLNPEDGNSFYKLGICYIKLDRYDLIIEHLLKAVDLGNINIINQMNELALHASNKLKIISHIIMPLNKTYIECGIEVEKAKVNMADAYLKYAELTMVRKKAHIDKAIKLYCEVDTEETLNKACSLVKSGLLTEKEKADVSYQMGNHYILKGNYAKALEMYKESIKLNPKFLDVYVQAETACTELNKKEDAEGFHYQASAYFESIACTLAKIVPKSDSEAKPILPIIQSYLFNTIETEMSGADSMLADY